MAKPNKVTREELILQAKQCLGEKGIEQFTLRKVAEYSDVTQGTIYYHFRTKEQLLMEIVKELCNESWSNLEEDEFNVRKAIAGAEERCSYDSLYHKLFLTLTVSSFQNEMIKKELKNVMNEENRLLKEHLETLWKQSSIEGVASESLAIMMNAIVDGLAIQALLDESFPVQDIYRDLQNLFKSLMKLS